MSRKNLDLFVVLLLTIIGSVVATTSFAGGIIRVMFTLLLVLVLPGYALTEALFAKRSMDLPEKLAFYLGLSLAVGVISGLILNLTPWGLQTGSWVILLDGLTVGAACVAMVRRRDVPAMRQISLRLSFRQGILFGLAVAIAGAALAVASLGVVRQPTQAFTQFWILPVEAANENTVELGISNMETVDVNYRVEILVGGIVLNAWDPVTLQHGEKWVVEYTLPQKQSETELVEAILYRLDSPDKIYRRVTFWSTP